MQIGLMNLPAVGILGNWKLFEPAAGHPRMDRFHIVSWLSLASVLAYVSASTAASQQSGIELILHLTTSGSFAISLGEDNDVWINSSDYGVRTNGKLMILGKDLVSNAMEATDGSDALGAYQAGVIKWLTKDTKEEVFHTIYKTYSNLPAVVLSQHFPVTLNNTSSSISSHLVSAFPTFVSNPEAVTTLNYATYEGTFPKMHVGHFSDHMDFPGGATGGVPMILYDKSLRTLVISPLDNFMTGIQAVDTDISATAVACGINGKVTSVPQGFNHSTIIWAGQGLQDTLYAWGGALLKYHGKTRTPLDSDFSVQYLGWWTDNGGYYHYNTEKNKTYQQTMLDAKAKLEELTIPARYFQLDSWWYFQEFPRGPVTLWEPRPDVFPAGMSDWLGLPLSLHNRWFAAKNNYSADWFLVKKGEDCALPASKELFDTMMQKTAKWGPGMFQYEQDWMTKTFLGCSHAQTDVTAARDWLTYMAQGAADANATIQYCMALPNHMLQSTALQPVTVSRATGDYSASSGQWAVGTTSLLYHAIGVIPFKDCFQTITGNEDGCPHKNKCQETNPVLQALVSTMSTGPIAPADGIQFMNNDTVALLKRTCRWHDGLILKPDVPAMIMDVVFETVFSDGKQDLFELWHTHSDFGGDRYHYVLAAVLKDNFTLTASAVGAVAGRDYVAYDYFHNCDMTDAVCTFTKWHAFNASAPLDIHVPKDEGVKTPTGTLPSHPFKYYVITPVLENGWTFLGEGMKFAVASRQRFVSITGNTGEDVEIVLVGTSGEEVSIYVLAPSGTIVTGTGTVGSSLRATVRCDSESPTFVKERCVFTSS